MANKHIKNYFYILFVQCGNYIFPLITIPVVSRIFGPELMGKYVLLTSIVGYFSLFVNYSFNYTGVRRITRGFERKNEIFYTIFFSQFIIALVISSFFLVCVYNISLLSENKLLSFICFISVFACLGQQNWIFQAYSDFKLITYISVLTKICALIFILIFVKHKDDMELYAFIVQLSIFIGAFIGFILSILKYKIKWVPPEFSVCLQYLKDDFYIFISSILSNLYTTTGVVILGMMTSNTEVGLYSSAQKIIDLMRNFSLLPLNMLIFPLLSAAFGHNKEIALEHIRRVMPLFCVFCLLSAVFIFLFGDLIILAFFGEQFSASSLLLKILSIGFVAVFFGVVIGGQVILNLQFDKQFVIMQLIVAIVSLILNFMILPSGGAITTAIIWSFSEVLMTGLQIIFLRMKGINLFYIQYFKPKLLFKTAIGLISK